MQTAQAVESDSDALIMTWKTDNTGDSNDTSITVPMVNGYWRVDWGDGVTEGTFSGPRTHDYGIAGTYTVKIWVGYASINFRDSGDKTKILSIDQWGTSWWGNGDADTSMAGAFARLPNLQVQRRIPQFSPTSTI